MYKTINGVKTHIEIEGSGNKTIITLHGGPGIGDGDDNKNMFKPFHDDFRVVYFDQRGNGRSDDAPPETYTHHQLVEDTETIRELIGEEKIILSGGSYGGILALEYALTYPHRVSCMILRGTAASNELQQHALKNALEAQLPGVNEDMLHNLFYGKMEVDDDLKNHFAMIYPLYSRKYTPEKARKLFDRKRFRHKTHNAFFQHAFPQYDIRDRLKEIKTPTLILAGKHDWITPMRFAEEIAGGLPNAHLEVFQDAGHSINSDMPERFQSVIRGYLSNIN